MIKLFWDRTAMHKNGLDFTLHDFGYRGVSSHESAEIGGAAHLLNFRGTDTLPAMECAMQYYGAGLDGLAYSVAATEHSIMTSMGPEGEVEVVRSLLQNYPKGILSVVADSYDIYNFVSNIMGNTFKQDILARDGVFVVRPDSVTPVHPTPAEETLWIANELFNIFGGTVNDKGFKVLHPKVRILWGDGIDHDGIQNILRELMNNKFSAENMVFGMGGGLLQKVNRDTQRFAFKSSAQCREDGWHDVFKQPKDMSKASKRGFLKLIHDGVQYKTVPATENEESCLKPVFRNGELIIDYSFGEIRERVRF